METTASLGRHLSHHHHGEKLNKLYAWHTLERSALINSKTIDYLEPTTQIQPPVQTQIQPPFLPPRMPPSFRFGGAGPQEYQQSMKSSNKLWKVYEAGDVPFGTIQSGLGYYEQTKKGEFFSLKQGRRSKGFLDVW